jgi:hypothetical protein
MKHYDRETKDEIPSQLHLEYCCIAVQTSIRHGSQTNSRIKLTLKQNEMASTVKLISTTEMLAHL